MNTITSSSTECWQLSAYLGLGIQTDGLEQSQVWAGASLPSDQYHPIVDEIRFRVAGIQGLRIRSELALFSLSMCAPPPSTGTLALEGGWSKRGTCGHLSWIGVHALWFWHHFRVPDCYWSTVSRSAHSGCLSLFRCCFGPEPAPPSTTTFSTARAALALMWSSFVEQEGPRQMPCVDWACTVDALLPVRVPDCSQSTSFASTSNDCPWPVWMLPQIQATPVPCNCVLPLAKAALVIVWSCARVAAQLVQGVCWGGSGKQARDLLPLSYFRSKQAFAHSSWVESRFLRACQSHWFWNHLKGLTFLVLDPRDREPSNWFQLIVPWEGPLGPCALSSSAPSLGRGGQLHGLASLPLHSVSRASFLHLWLWKSLNASLHFVFGDNCSTHRCIFDVLVGGSELCILLCHLDPTPQVFG